MENNSLALERIEWHTPVFKITDVDEIVKNIKIHAQSDDDNTPCYSGECYQGGECSCGAQCNPLALYLSCSDFAFVVGREG